MRSIRMLAVVTGTLVLASACSDGGGTPPPDNVAPVANFTAPSCTVNVECTFTSTSTDDVAVTEHRWDLNGDGTPDKTGASVTQIYTAAGNVTVILTAVDAGGLTGTKTNLVTVSAAPVVNAPPVANFTAPSCTVGAACTFTDASTDDVAVATWNWNFGDGSANVTTKDAVHTYLAAGTYSVVLTVTDGGVPALTDDVTQTVTVTPPAPAQCTTAGTLVDCSLGFTARATLKFTLTGVNCELAQNRVTMPAIAKTVFGNACSKQVGDEYIPADGTGAPMVFEAGTVLVRFTQGIADPGDPAVGAPRANLQGAYPNWTLSIDDGGNPTGAGEPDFTDVVLFVEATPVP